MTTSAEMAEVRARLDELAKGLESAYTMATHSEVVLGVLLNELKESGALSDERAKAMFQKAAALTKSASEQPDLPKETRRVMAEVHKMLSHKQED